jgi:large subunit ribosomal protein L17
MRHGKKVKKLNRTSSHRKALMSNLASSLIVHKQIRTTDAKAKELRRYAERLVTYAKKDSLHGRRLILKNIKGSNSKEIANILMHEIAPVYKDRNGGYTRIIKLGNRKNDNSLVSIIEFVDFKKSINEEDALEDKAQIINSGAKQEK